MIVARDLTFGWDNSAQPLFAGLSASFPRGFTGVIGANGVGKTTLLKLLVGGLVPSSGTVQGAQGVVWCEQRTDQAPTEFQEFLADWDAQAFEFRGRLGIEPEFLDRWQTLSHGERKRSQIACALWQDPQVLAIDEPTNHIDAKARALLIDALECYRGVGLIVSHDRDLLDTLCTQCIWLEPPNTLVVPGGYTKARAQRDLNRQGALRERDNALRERKRLERETHKRREQAARSHHDRSKSGIAIKDHDARFKKNLARISGKDGQAGRLLRQLNGRAERSQARVDAVTVNKEHDVGIWLPGSRSWRTTLLHVEAGVIALGNGRTLKLPQLVLKPEDRVAVTGLNGLGKSTLIHHLISQANVPVEHLTVLPQEVDAARARALLDETRGLPRGQLGQVMNVVSRLGSRPERLLRSHQPSPGELRKLLLALGMARAPNLIVMDEPTNHLDLPSIEALEQALADCPCALLLVSHDQRFLDALVDVTWHIERAGNGDSELSVG
jgi:ATPase subunit of ABC transporter with duplicated ATPase domains